jgi:hypothetical protein
VDTHKIEQSSHNFIPKKIKMKRNIMYARIATIFLHLLLNACHAATVTTEDGSIGRSSYPYHELDIPSIPVRRNDPKHAQQSRNEVMTRSLVRNPMDRQAHVWEIIGTMESYKKDEKLFATTR